MRDSCHVPSVGPVHSEAGLPVVLCCLRPHGGEAGAAGWRLRAEPALFVSGAERLEPLLLRALQVSRDRTPAICQAQGETLCYLV